MAWGTPEVTLMEEEVLGGSKRWTLSETMDISGQS